ncbi:MAG: HDOD domain-containing protein [Candidatus Nitrospinota bacterium M3_3B_026]
MELQARQLVDLVDRMPGFSPAVAKIIALANNPATKPAELVNVISMDSVLTAKILRLVNSAYFGPGRNIASLGRAVIMLGFNTIKNMALSVSVASAVSIKSGFRWFSNDEYWEHCLGCALAARELARASGAGARIEEYFVAGLLHDIGKAALIQGLEARIEKIYDPNLEPETPRFMLETERLGLNHAEVGQMIAEKWKLPDSLTIAIGHHHTPLKAPEEGRGMALTVHVADIAAHHLKIGIQTTQNLDTIYDRVWEAFGLSREQTLDAISGLESAVDDAKVFLQKVD